MRSVVLLPQPEGPTSTTNSLSGMSRLMRAHGFDVVEALDHVTQRDFGHGVQPFGGAGGQAGDVVVHQEGVDDERRRGGDQRAGHQHAPLVDVAADQAGHGADGEHLLVRRIEERHRIDEGRPRHGEGEDRRGDDAGQRHRDEDLEQHLHVAGAVDQRRLVELLGDRLEIADHDPGAERHRQRRIDQHHAPIGIEQADRLDDLEQRNEQQRVGHEVGEEDAGRQDARAPELHAAERERGQHADHHGDRDHAHRHDRRCS